MNDQTLKRYAVLTAAAGLSVWAIDMAATQVGLPSMQAALGVSVTASQWILNLTLMLLAGIGFWSLTLYNDAFLLVDNPIDRYIIRPDQPGLTYNPDGSLTIYIQAEKPAGVTGSNWLPAPSGSFSVALRTYLPQKAILDGIRFPPGLERSI